MRRTIVLYTLLYPLWLALFLLGPSGRAAGEDIQDSIGRFVIAKGNVLVRHQDAPTARAVKVKDSVFFMEQISTAKESRAKILFLDDTVLTIAPNSTVEINETVYDPEKNQRKTVIYLAKGILKALVRPSLEGSGSKVEVQTPTAVAAVRGTRFIVAVEADGTQILNISDSEHSEIDIKKAATPGEVVLDTDPVMLLNPGESGFVPGGIGEIVIEPISMPLRVGYEQALGSSGEAEDAILSVVVPTPDLPVVVSTPDPGPVDPGPEPMERYDKPLLELIPDLIPDQQPSQPQNNVTIKVRIP